MTMETSEQPGEPERDEMEEDSVKSTERRSSSKKRKRNIDEEKTANIEQLTSDAVEVGEKSTTKKRKKAEKGKEEKKKKKPRQKKKKLSRKAILFATPTAAEQADPLADLPPTSERCTYLHGHNAVQLPSRDVVHAMSDSQRHTYIKFVTGQCERILETIHDVLARADHQHLADSQPSLNEQLMADMVKLKRLPLARRYVEMTLWQRVTQFNEECLSKIESLAFGAGEIESSEKRPGILLHRSDSKDVKFNSFRDKYMKNLLDDHEEDLEKLRLTEGMDEEQVASLRRCLESSAALFANVKCLDDEHERENLKILCTKNVKN